MKGHSGPVRSIILTTDEKKMITGSKDKSIIIWDLIGFQKISQLEGHSGDIYCLALTSDEKLILSGSTDYTMRIWDMQTGSEINQYKQDLFVNCILRVNNRFLSLSQNASMGQLDMDKGDFHESWLLKSFEMDSVSFSADYRVISYGSQREAAVWELDQDKCVLVGHSTLVEFVEVSRDLRFAISGSYGPDDNLIYWDIKEHKKSRF